LTGKVTDGTCTDSDGGKNYYVRGSTEGKNPVDEAWNDIEEDACLDNNLVEWYCNPETKDNEVYTCPNGCVYGACIDEDRNILFEGKKRIYALNGIDYDITADFVGFDAVRFTINGEITSTIGEADSYIIRGGKLEVSVIEIISENFADGVRYVEFAIAQPKGCVRAIPTIKISPDYQEGRLGEGLAYTATVTNNDNEACGSSRFYVWGAPNLYEIPVNSYPNLGEPRSAISPGDFSIYDVEARIHSYAAEEGKTYKAGVMVKNAELDSFSAPIYEAYAELYVKPEQVSTDCESLSKDSATASYFTLCGNEGYDNVCFNKFTSVYQGCTKDTYDDCTEYNTNAKQNILCNAEQAKTCTETDGGIDYNLKGSAKGLFGISSEGYGPGKLFDTFTDHCLSDIAIMENYCKENSEGDLWVYQSYYICPNGCYNGACIDEDRNILFEGKKRIYALNGIDYEITADFVGFDGAKFSINGELTPLIGEADSYTLSDGKLEINVIEIISENFAGGVRYVEFTISVGKIPSTTKPNQLIDLSNYPDLFISNGRFNGVLVVGDRASAQNVISLIDIASSLNLVERKLLQVNWQAN